MYKVGEQVQLCLNGKPLLEMHGTIVQRYKADSVSYYQVVFEGLSYAIGWIKESDLASIDRMD